MLKTDAGIGERFLLPEIGLWPLFLYMHWYKNQIFIGGYLTRQTISWGAYNEASDLQDQAETYRLLTVHYPELIQCDKIYHTNDNRSWCSERDIRMTTLPKRPKSKLSAYEKRKQRDEYAERNHIEGRIGNAKQALSLNQIKANLQGTSDF